MSKIMSVSIPAICPSSFYDVKFGVQLKDDAILFGNGCEFARDCSDCLSCITRFNSHYANRTLSAIQQVPLHL